MTAANEAIGQFLRSLPLPGWIAIVFPALLLLVGTVGCHARTCFAGIFTVEARYSATCAKLFSGGLPGATMIFLTPACRRLLSTRWSGSLNQQIAISVVASSCRNAEWRMPVVENSSLHCVCSKSGTSSPCFHD